MDDRAAREQVARLETLVERLERLPDEGARGTALEAVQLLLALHGEALSRILARATESTGAALIERLAEDELVSHLLLLHGLHPVAVEDRVKRALEEVRPYLRSHGGNVELVRVADGVAHVRMQGSCSGCPSSSVTLRLAIEEAIQRAAPDLERVEAEGAVEPARSALVPLTGGKTGAPGDAERAEAKGWTVVGSLPQLAGGGTLVREVAGEPVLFLRLDGNYYAYRPGCPGCGASLAGGTLRATELACPHCGHRYDVLRAGRCLDAPRLHLEPVPLLLADSGVAKIALPALAE